MVRNRYVRIKDKPLKPITTRWRTRDGSKVRVCDMDDGHLLNTIRFLKHKVENWSSFVPVPFGFDPDTEAYHLAEAQWDAMVEEGAPFEAIYYDMLEEMNRRGLSLDDRSLIRRHGKIIVDFSKKG